MKMTKRLMAMAMCGIMAATSMVGVYASASDTTVNDNYIVSEFEQNDKGIMPYATTSGSISITRHYQEETNWCWAACTQVVLEKYGVTKTQEEIVKAVKNTDTAENVMGNAEEVTDVLNKFYSKGKFANKTGKGASAYYIKNKIAADKPVILFGTQTNGKNHAVVCYGYEVDGEKYTFKIFDPNNGNGTIKCNSKNDTSYSMNVSGNDSKTFDTLAFVSSAS